MTSFIELTKIDEISAWKKYSRNASIDISRIDRKLLTPKPEDSPSIIHESTDIDNKSIDTADDTDNIIRKACMKIKRELLDIEIPAKIAKMDYSDSDDEPLLVIAMNKKERNSSTHTDSNFDGDHCKTISDDEPLVNIKRKSITIENTSNDNDTEVDNYEHLLQIRNKIQYKTDESEEESSPSSDAEDPTFTPKGPKVPPKSKNKRKKSNTKTSIDNDTEEELIKKRRAESKRKGCHTAASTIEWSDKFDPVFGEARVAKRVELPDIEQVRRVNSNILTAQVAPITAAVSAPFHYD